MENNKNTIIPVNYIGYIFTKLKGGKLEIASSCTLKESLIKGVSNIDLEDKLKNEYKDFKSYTVIVVTEFSYDIRATKAVRDYLTNDYEGNAISAILIFTTLSEVEIKKTNSQLLKHRYVVYLKQAPAIPKKKKTDSAFRKALPVYKYNKKDKSLTEHVIKIEDNLNANYIVVDEDKHPKRVIKKILEIHPELTLSDKSLLIIHLANKDVTFKKLEKLQKLDKSSVLYSTYRVKITPDTPNIKKYLTSHFVKIIDYTDIDDVYPMNEEQLFTLLVENYSKKLYGKDERFKEASYKVINAVLRRDIQPVDIVKTANTEVWTYILNTLNASLHAKTYNRAYNLIASLNTPYTFKNNITWCDYVLGVASIADITKLLNIDKSSESDF